MKEVEGISYNNRAKKWQVKVFRSRYLRRMGYFDTKEEAEEAYPKLAARLKTKTKKKYPSKVSYLTKEQKKKEGHIFWDGLKDIV